MARLTRWVQKVLGRAPDPSALGTAREAPPPRAVHERHWKFPLKSHEGRFSEMIVVVVLGSPGIGRKSLSNKLLYDDMHGGHLLEMSLMMMDDEIPRYMCGEYIHDLNLIMSADYVASCYICPPNKFLSVVLAYDVNSQASFDEVSSLYKSICVRQEGGRPGCHILILGLKADSDGAGGRVPRETGEAFALERGCSFMECSAKSGDGAYEAFGSIVQHAHGKAEQFAEDPEGRKSFMNETHAMFLQVMQSMSPS